MSYLDKRTMLSKARSEVIRLEADLTTARESERKEINDGALNHTPIGNSYWHNRHFIEQKLDAAKRLVQALED